MKEQITIPSDFFEHLLACLANQKFIHVINADAIQSELDGELVIKDKQAENQKVIDDAWDKGMEMLCSLK